MARVLLVDHDLDSREPLEVLVANAWAHELATADSAHEALDKLGSFRPHVVVTNRGLPGTDGEALAREIRKRGDSQTFIICLTGYSDKETHRRILDAGCDLVLDKPVDLTALEEALARA